MATDATSRYEDVTPRLVPPPAYGEATSGSLPEAHPHLSRKFQYVSIVLCVLLAAVLVLNNQMGGEAMWFWYGTVFRQGAKLYSELHTALQPLFVLETSAWLGLFGRKIAVYEIPSLIHAFLLAVGIYLILRESDWKDWQKAVALFGTFVFTVAGHSYRFDDYHVLTEALITYALLVLLQLGRKNNVLASRAQFLKVGLLGLLCGLSIVTRVTDGAALVTSALLSLPFLLKRQRLASMALMLAVAAATVLFVVRLTGDSFSMYLSSTLFRAAASKGGTGSIFAAPFLMFVNTFGQLNGQKKYDLALVVIVGLGWAIARFRPDWRRFIIPAQLGLATAICLMCSDPKKYVLKRGLFFEDTALLLTFTMYFVFAAILVQYVRHKRGQGSWDPRYILLLVPILEWASYSAGAAAEPVTNYYAPAALILLLIPVLDPFRRWTVWAKPSVLTVFILIAVNGLYGKKVVPYAWQNYYYGQIFKDHVWFQHPVYGEMYINRDLLNFSEEVCRDIRSQPGVNHPTMLSLPYPYPNYFCDTPPWHNYVQTFFDTATRNTIEQLMHELQTAPPEWIVYQRQLNIMRGSERLYNHGQPIAQRDLDAMIMQKIRTGQWKLVDESSYLKLPEEKHPAETDWYIIQTHP